MQVVGRLSDHEGLVMYGEAPCVDVVDAQGLLVSVSRTAASDVGDNVKQDAAKQATAKADAGDGHDVVGRREREGDTACLVGDWQSIW